MGKYSFDETDRQSWSTVQRKVRPYILNNVFNLNIQYEPYLNQTFNVCSNLNRNSKLMLTYGILRNLYALFLIFYITINFIKLVYH